VSSPQHCLAMADEAERLVGIVSYERDRERLRTQAAAWRQMANTFSMSVAPVAQEPPAAVADAPRSSGVAAWLMRRRAS
jgi:hypothetical protein